MFVGLPKRTVPGRSHVGRRGGRSSAAGGAPARVVLLLGAAISTGVVSLMLSGGCAHYSFSPSLRSQVKNVAVPVLANETLEYGAGQAMTDAIIEQFTVDNSLRVVGEKAADSIIRGRIVSYERKVFSYDSGGNPREYRVTAVAGLSYVDLRKNEVIWEADVEGWAIYGVSGSGGETLTTEDEAKEAAFVKLAEDVLGRTVQGW